MRNGSGERDEFILKNKLISAMKYNPKVITIYCEEKAGKGLNPTKCPSVANVDKLTTPIAIIYNRKIAKTRKIIMSVLLT